MSENIIEISGLSKSFADHDALRDITFNVKKDEFLTLLGPSGCGKTTLLRMISGFEYADKGTIRLNGRDMQDVPANLRQVHTVFQSYALFPHMTVFENVAFGLRCQKVANDEVESRVKEALEFVKLEKMMQRLPKNLSGGQQQRVAIARAIVNKPLVLLLDEPFSSLDYRLRKNMRVELKQLQRKLGITFIFVTHDQEEALSMSDRIVVMDDGIVQQIGTPLEVYEEPINLKVAKFIGELNIFTANVFVADGNNLQAEIDDIAVTLHSHYQHKVHDKVHVLVRPEDMRAYAQNEAVESPFFFHGKVIEVIYKGTMVDLMVRLHTGQTIAVTEFFDGDHEKLTYNLNETVKISWLSGSEVVLPYEHD